MALLSAVVASTRGKVLAVYFDHGIRALSERLRDIQTIQTFCDNESVRLVVRKLPVRADVRRSKDGIEAAGRRWRYRMLTHLARLNQANAIMTAHHLNDSAETVLLKIVRGSGAGLSGISLFSERTGIPIVRPLIQFTKHELENYCKRQGVGYVVDSTNSNNDYSRNRIRNRVFPELRKVNSNVDTELCRFAARIQTMSDFVRSQIPCHLMYWNHHMFHISNQLRDYHIAIQNVTILDAFSRLSIEPSADRIERVLSLMTMDPCPQIQLTAQWYADHRDGALRFKPATC